jgi:hypothetical protein
MTALANMDRDGKVGSFERDGRDGSEIKVR